MSVTVIDNFREYLIWFGLRMSSSVAPHRHRFAPRRKCRRLERAAHTGNMPL